MIAVIGRPDVYAGHKVRLIGFLHIEFEGTALFLDRESYQANIDKNAIWVNLPVWAARCNDMLNNRYVLIEGRFDEKDRGHMGMNSGSVGEIERLEPWEWGPGGVNEDHQLCESPTRHR